MKATQMKSITQNAAHIAATAQLNQLQQAHAAAMFEEAALLAQLSDQPENKPSALDRAKAMLTGGTPAPRQDHDGLQIRLTACRETLALLVLAIGEQRAVMTGLVQAQSAVINAEAKQAHIKAAEGIKTALAGLRAALETEQGLRGDIEAGGYQCSLEPLARLELSFDDSQTTVSRFARDVDAFLMVHELAAAKSVNVRLLCGTGGNLPGDVLTMTGHEAAALLRVGHAEQTRDKPSRVTRPVRESYGQTMATALG
jgi:hypothetical protein